MPFSSVHLKKKNLKASNFSHGSSSNSKNKEFTPTLQNEKPFTLSIHNKPIFTIQPLHEINVEFLKKSFDKKESNPSKKKILLKQMVDSNSRNKETILKLASFKEIVSLPASFSLDLPLQDKTIFNGPSFSFTSIPFSPISTSNPTASASPTTISSPIPAPFSIPSSPFPYPSWSCSSSLSSLFIDSSTSKSTTTSAWVSNSKLPSVLEINKSDIKNFVPEAKESTSFSISLHSTEQLPLSLSSSSHLLPLSSSSFTEPRVSPNQSLQPTLFQTSSSLSKTEPPPKLFLNLQALLDEPNIKIKSVSNHIQPRIWKPFFKLNPEKRG